LQAHLLVKTIDPLWIHCPAIASQQNVHTPAAIATNALFVNYLPFVMDEK